MHDYLIDRIRSKAFGRIQRAKKKNWVGYSIRLIGLRSISDLKLVLSECVWNCLVDIPRRSKYWIQGTFSIAAYAVGELGFLPSHNHTPYSVELNIDATVSTSNVFCFLSKLSTYYLYLTTVSDDVSQSMYDALPHELQRQVKVDSKPQFSWSTIIINYF